MPAVDLRELVKEPIRLTGSPRARAQPHPLHDAIAGDRRFTSPSAAPIYLPSAGRGLHRLKLTLQAPIAGVEDARAAEAYVRLLSEGPAFLREPGAVTHDADGAPLGADDVARARSALLTAVFCDDDEHFDGASFSAPRFGAVGVLSMLPDPTNSKRSEDAWLEVAWFHSTSSMARGLQHVAGLGLEPPKLNRAVEILITEGLAREGGTLRGDVERIAHLLGVKPRIHLLSKERVGKIAGQVKANSAAELFVLGADVDERVVSAFTSRRGERDLHRAEVASPDAAVQWLLDNLPRIMGVGPALMSHPEVQPAPGRPRLPVSNPARCLHHGDNTYVLEQTTDLWWTRDFAQHGSDEKSVFKTYTKVNGALLWNGDHDAAGSTIEGKHKGSIGVKIELRNTNSCAHPESHLR